VLSFHDGGALHCTVVNRAPIVKRSWNQEEYTLPWPWEEHYGPGLHWCMSEIVMESNSGSARLRLEPKFFLLLEKLEPKIRVF
jgi:hypothetical protein